MGVNEVQTLGTLTGVLERRQDGSILVRSRETLSAWPDRSTDRLDYWAKAAPDRVFLAQRERSGGWRTITYAQTRESVRRIASALLQRNLSADRPIAILSGNDIEQGLLGLAAMMIGVPFAPVSPAYSLVSTDHEKLRAILDTLTPGMVFVSNAVPFAKAIAATCADEVEIVATQGELAGRQVTAFSAIENASASPALDAAVVRVGPETVAKILFTSGSTGLPKGVINTQRMLNANQAMLAHWLPFCSSEPPVLVDWLPWHHTFGGNHNFGFVLNNGGSLYIDNGKPVPSGIAETVRNLKEVAPTIYFNVPKGFEELAQVLKTDRDLRNNFFSRLRANFYAGAGLPPHVSKMLEDIARDAIGRPLPMITGLGATESAPSALASTNEKAPAGNVGLPLPGITLKLIENSGKLEARLKGPSITPGYWRNPQQTAKAFDEEGFYCLGDALKFADPVDLQAGMIFDGRVSEDFKLVTGTWVSVGPLRSRLISTFAPLARDAVIAGHDRDDIRVLVFPDFEACRQLIGTGSATLSEREVVKHPAIRSAFAERLSEFGSTSSGSSNRVAHVMLLDDLPSIDANEITDKGSINQRAVLTRRAALVEELYSNPHSPDVIQAR
ncbi:CaiC Acyl-CoA synthetases (AMP-forming)/AMP-acid ligases II [Rhabdaerophilaceae bacterium]